MIILITGGARSGKSSFAEEMAWYFGDKDVVYIATAEIRDKEMEKRVEKHKSKRPEDWKTIEEPFKLSQVLSKLNDGQVILIDCITVYVSNLLLQGKDVQDEINFKADISEEEIMDEVKKIITYARKKDLKLIIVSNELGQGLVPTYELGRIYRDIIGRINQKLAREADKVYISIAGLPLEIKESGMINIEKFKRDYR